MNQISTEAVGVPVVKISLHNPEVDWAQQKMVDLFGYLVFYLVFSFLSVLLLLHWSPGNQDFLWGAEVIAQR